MAGRNRPRTSESTVDLTRRYLSELGSYPLLTAEQEVELAQAIETGRAGRDRAAPSGHAHAGAARRSRAADRRSGGGPPHLHPVEPAARRVDRQALPGHRHDAPRPHPGGQPRPDAGGREVRPPQGLQVLHLRHLVDPPVDRPRHRRQGPHHPAALAPRRHDGRAVEGVGAPAQDARARAHRRRAGRGDGHDRGAGARGARTPGPTSCRCRCRSATTTPSSATSWPTTTPRCPSRWRPCRWPATTSGPARLPQPPRAGDPVAAVRARGRQQPLTLDEVGRRFNVTRERIRQIEAKALTKLRHPCSARHRRLVSPRSG